MRILAASQESEPERPSAVHADSRDGAGVAIITSVDTPAKLPPAPIDAPADAAATLTALYWAAVGAAAPGPALRAALARIAPDQRTRPVWIIAIGKAAHPMAAAAVAALDEWDRAPAGGVIVAPNSAPPPHAALDVCVGDHPVPGARSRDAAAHIARVASQVRAGDDAWVLLSGGATSLTAAPIEPVQPEELVALYRQLLGAGLDIAAMNLVRKRFSRWGAGRLAVALAPARVRNYIVSDVIGDDLAAIGSGPCVPDASTAGQIHAMLDAAGLWARLPQSMRQLVTAAERDPSLETPKPDAGAFAAVEPHIIASNRIALDAAAAHAARLGYTPHIVDAALSGEAAIVGRRLVATIATYHGPGGASLSGRSGQPCLIWGGETTVTLGEATGRGGRCQELALAAAGALAASPAMAGVALLAAGTDGRDGDTDAAGAIVTGRTWDAVRRAGRDPAADFAAHDSYAALDAAHALLRTGLTATNVMDIVIAIGAGHPPGATDPASP